MSARPLAFKSGYETAEKFNQENPKKAECQECELRKSKNEFVVVFVGVECDCRKQKKS